MSALLTDVTKTSHGWRVSRSFANVPQQNPLVFVSLREALGHARDGGQTALRVWYKGRVVASHPSYGGG